ncbi:MAG: signal peptidase I [Bacteroidota bacterium]
MIDESIHTENDAAVPARTWQQQAVHLFVGYGKTILITLLLALTLKTFVVEAFRIPSGSMENTLLVGDFLLVNKFAYGLRSPRYVPLTDKSIPSFTLPLFSSVHRGDVVVFEFPGGRDEVQASEHVNYIKRCIGLSGDRVEIRRGEVFVNGLALTFPKEGIQPSHPEGAYWHKSYQLFPAGTQFTDINYGPLAVPKRGDEIKLSRENITLWRTLIAREGHATEILPSGEVTIDGERHDTYRVERDYYFMMGDNRDNSLDSRYWGFVPEDNLVGEALLIYWSWDPEVPVGNLYEKVKSIRWERIGKMVR